MAAPSIFDLDRTYDVTPYVGAMQSLWGKAKQVEEQETRNGQLLALSMLATITSVGFDAPGAVLLASAGVSAVAVGRAYWTSYVEKERVHEQVGSVLESRREYQVGGMEVVCGQFDELLADGAVEQAMDLLNTWPEVARYTPLEEFSALACAMATGEVGVCERLLALGADIESPIRRGSDNTGRSMAAQVLMRGENPAAALIADTVLSGERGIMAQRLTELGMHTVRGPIEGQTTGGKVLALSDSCVGQSIGRGVAVVFDKRGLDQAVQTGDQLTVKYENGRGHVVGVEKQGHGVGR